MLGAWSPPAQFEEYRLVRVLGRGAMGTVWLAHDLDLDRPVAIKFISEAQPGGAARDRFFVEARAVARLHHPNVATVHRVGEVDGHRYILSEYVRGTTLDKLARPVDAELGFDVALGLARGLAVAHRHSVLHRDIKPANAILTEDKEVKLLDFGLAKLFDGVEARAEPAPALVTSGVTQTEAGTILGTPAYLAPEIWAGEAATAATDVYALGATLFHLLTDRLPHAAPTAVAVAALAMREDAPPLRSLRPECPAALAEVVDLCLGRDPAARPAHGEAVREALEARARAARRPALPAGNPYRSLHAFGPEHRHLFFGRELEIADVLELLRAEAWVVVAGRSGAGKSSLVRAGVAPRVVDDNALGEGGPAAWRVLPLVPGARPQAALVAGAAALLDRDEAALALALAADPELLARELRGDRKTGTLILIDQLEELVTLAGADERARFLETLRHLRTPAPSVRVVATLRSDFVGDFDRELTRALYVLGPMTPEGLRDAVVAPAAAHGVTFEAEADVDALVAAVADNQGSLPLLEFALAKLWDLRRGKAIPHAAVESIGGVAGALARHADEVIARLGPGAEVRARRIFLRLVTAERTRARRTEAELHEGPEDRAVLEALVRGRLLAAGDGTYEVAHEALIASWTRLRLWLDEERGVHQLRERLEVAAADWERLGRRADDLWSGRRVEELGLLESAALGPREREFAAAARRSARRQRWARRSLLVAAPTLLLVTILGVQAWNRRAARARADAAVTRARELLVAAREQSAVVALLRAATFAAYDAEAFTLGGALWSQVEAATEPETERYDAVQEPLYDALAAVAGYPPARRLASDLYADRFLIAERDHDDRRMAGDALQLKLNDAEQRHGALLDGGGSLAVTSVPAGATVALSHFDEDERGRLVPTPVASLGITPIAERPIPMGSYLLEVAHDGHDPVRYPVRVARGARARATVVLIPHGRVPAGFIHVPGGETLVGARHPSPERGFVSPEHVREVRPFFMARTEVTLGQYLEFVESLTGNRDPFLLHGMLRVGPEGKIVTDLSAFNMMVLARGSAFTYRPEVNGREGSADFTRWPVSYIASYEAEAYLEWLRSTGRMPGARLCTLTEWERAARGADGRPYPHGTRLLPGDASFGETYGAENAVRRWLDEVERFPQSASVFGIHDLAGGVAEMVTTDHPDRLGLILAKPGSWRQLAGDLTADHIASMAISQRSVETGFRVCASAD